LYRWRQAYAERGEAGLINAPPIPKWHANRTPPEREDKVLYPRRKYHLGPIRIVWYLERYHGIQKHPDADRSGVSTNDPLTSTWAQRILLMKKITILRRIKSVTGFAPLRSLLKAIREHKIAEFPAPSIPSLSSVHRRDI